MQTSHDRRELRVLEIPKAMLVRVPLEPGRRSEFRVLTRGDTLLIAGDGQVESIRLPRQAAPRGLTANQDGNALYVRVPLEREMQPSWQAGRPAEQELVTVAEVTDAAPARRADQ
ncbi:MAG TPA: hypothetical protein VHX16_12280 [Chloroflexota bacterium]|jgi:hypothetical protein|nr:hypothetical protein [Chloroflexota bacterium]